MTTAPVDPHPSNAVAAWSLVLAALPVPVLWLVSIGLGVAVLARSKDGRNHGRTLVVVGFSIIAVWVVLLVAAVAIVIALDLRPEPGTADVRGNVLIEDFRVGDCTAADLDEVVTHVEVVPCDARHRLETFAVFALPAGAFPGQDNVDRLSEGGCSSRFEEFVGLAYEDSTIDFQYVTPVEDIWADDRSVVCLLDTGDMTNGSLKNARE